MKKTLKITISPFLWFLFPIFLLMEDGTKTINVVVALVVCMFMSVMINYILPDLHDFFSLKFQKSWTSQ